MSRNSLVTDLQKHFAERGPVEITETSKSWVFLTPDRVFKLKKQVRDDLQDLVPLRARHDNTLTEIDLNRRLAPDTYVGAVQVGRKDDGRLALDHPKTRTVDWLIEMNRLPAEQMLEARIAEGATQDDLAGPIHALSQVLADFYLTAPMSRLKAHELATAHQSQLDLARDVLLHPLFAEHHRYFQSVLGKVDASWSEFIELLDDRLGSHAIVEGHGDLRPEHICLLDTPVIYDCLEFNRTLRLVDPYSEIMFLSLECAVLGADWIGPQLSAALEAKIGPAPSVSLLRFYEVLHAITRARLCLSHLFQQNPRTPKKWLPLGLWYVKVADRRLTQIGDAASAVHGHTGIGTGKWA